MLGGTRSQLASFQWRGAWRNVLRICFRQKFNLNIMQTSVDALTSNGRLNCCNDGTVFWLSTVTCTTFTVCEIKIDRWRTSVSSVFLWAALNEN